MIIKKNKKFLEKLNTESKVPPSLKIQIWDNDSLSSNDFIGTLSLNLSKCQIPTKNAKKCRLKNYRKRLNVFNARKLKGWFPVYGNDENQESFAIVQTVNFFKFYLYFIVIFYCKI